MKNIKEITTHVNDVVMAHLPNPENYPSSIVDAMNYAMSSGGKRIRPTLMYLAYMTFMSSRNGLENVSQWQESEKCCEAFMAAIEMIHTHSLIHDDLPALDNDNLRRGRPTVHVAFDDSTAILAGDALLNYAYEVTQDFICNAPVSQRLTSYIRSQNILLNKTGINGMLGGQGLDVQLSGKEITNVERDYIYKNKTCALLEAPLMIGACLAGASDEYIAKMEQAGRAIGMAFQVQDDILDVTSDTETLGKEVHQDARNEKNTFVAQYGLEASKDYVREESEKAVKIIESVTSVSEYKDLLVGLVRSMIDRKN